MLKKIISTVFILIITLIICLSFVACESLSFEFKTEVNEQKAISYSIVGIKTWVKKSELVIPEKYLGSPVTKIDDLGDSPFLEDITIPDSIMSITKGAFNKTGCYTKSKNWKDDVLYIGGYLIEAKGTLKGNYVVEEGTKGIANEAFSHCNLLAEVTLADSVQTICEWGFVYSNSLTKITFGKGIKGIGNSSFLGCKKLQSVTIPESVIDMGKNVFFGCTSLEKATICGNVGTIKESTFQGCTSLDMVTLCEGITSIGNNAFSGCKALKNITFPDGLKSIDSAVFSNCTSLDYVIIPDSVKSIGHSIYFNSNAVTYYKGNINQWENTENSADITNEVYFYSENRPLGEGNYWHFDFDERTPVKW